MREQFRHLVEALERGRRFVTHDVWHIGLPGEEVPHGLIIKQIRVVILLMKGVLKETFLLRAAALTFYTTLSIVPLLALMFFVIQFFDIGDLGYKVGERVTMRLEQLGFKDGLSSQRQENAADATERNLELQRKIVDLVIPEDMVPRNGSVPGDGSVPGENTESPNQGASLVTENVPGGKEAGATSGLQRGTPEGSTPVGGLAAREDVPVSGGGEERTRKLGAEEMKDPVTLILEWAGQGANLRSLGVMGVIFIVTTAFGLMMNIEGAFNSIWGLKRTRSWYRTFSDYIIIVFLLPFFVGLAIGCNAFLQDQLQGVLSLGLKASQYVVVWLAFAVLYFAVPSTRVKFRYALLAGVIAGTMWSITAALFFKFQYGLARYSLVYSGFALFPMLLMWVYVSWVIVLFGAELTFAYQNEKTFAMERLASGASFAYREALGLRTMIELGRRFDRGLAPFAVTESAEEWNVPTRLINDALEQLEDAGLVLRCATEPPTYQPSRSLTRITVLDVVAAIRGAGRDPSDLRKDGAFRPLLDEIDGKNSGVMNSSLADVIVSVEQHEGEKPATVS